MSNIGNRETLAKNLKHYLNKTGKSQREVAEYVGVASSTFNDWVKAKKYPRIDKIEMMADYFGVLKSSLIEEREGKDAIAERAAFDAAMAKDEDLREMVKKYMALPEDKKKTVKQMIEDYYDAFA